MDYSIYLTDEIARKAKKLGFDCKLVKNDNSCKTFTENYPHLEGMEQVVTTFYYKIPTAEEVCGWLRKEKNLAIVVESSLQDSHSFWINKIDEIHSDSLYVSPFDFSSYNDAILHAIDIALDLVNEE